jgi:hypothetical protein
MDHWHDAGLTLGERADLLVLAENATDATRETFGPVHEAYILKRAGKTAATWRNAIGKLMKRGVLEYAVREGREMSGWPGQYAIYRFAQLCPEGKHDGLRGQCKREERVTWEVTQPDADLRTGHPTGDPITGTGHLTGGERVTSQVTPTPLVSSEDSPLSPADPPAPPAAPDEREIDPLTRKLMTEHQATADEVDAVLGQVRAEGRIGSVVAWANSKTGHADIRQRLHQVRLEQQARASPGQPARPVPDWCGTCNQGDPSAATDPGRRWIEHDDGSAERCHCHPDHKPQAA